MFGSTLREAALFLRRPSEHSSEPAPVAGFLEVLGGEAASRTNSVIGCFEDMTAAAPGKLMMLEDMVLLSVLASGGMLVLFQSLGNRGAPTEPEDLSIGLEIRHASCYAVATPVAEPGKSRQNPPKQGCLYGLLFARF